jgi:hypothetical protein
MKQKLKSYTELLIRNIRLKFSFLKTTLDLFYT